MTISLYSGTPGSGKSLHATERIYKRLNRKLPVIANYNLDKNKIPNSKLFTYIDNSSLTPDLLVRNAGDWFSRHRFGEDRILLVIDECQLLFNSREWQNSDRMAWLEFFSQHRKYGFAVILVAQFDKMVDRQFRSLVEYEYIHRKVSNFGLAGWCLSLLFGGRAHVVVQRYYPLSQKVGSRFFIPRKKWFGLYDSYGTFRRDDAPDLPDSPPALATS